MLKDFLPAILWALIILILSAGPGISLPEEWWDLFSPDKFGHLAFYGVLSFLLIYGFFKRKDYSKKKEIQSIILASSFGIAMEVMQYAFFPGRYFEIMDIIANIIGSIIGLVLFRKFH